MITAERLEELEYQCSALERECASVSPQTMGLTQIGNEDLRGLIDAAKERDECERAYHGVIEMQEKYAPKPNDFHSPFEWIEWLVTAQKERDRLKAEISQLDGKNEWLQAEVKRFRANQQSETALKAEVERLRGLIKDIVESWGEDKERDFYETYKAAKSALQP